MKQHYRNLVRADFMIQYGFCMEAAKSTSRMVPPLQQGEAEIDKPAQKSRKKESNSPAQSLSIAS